MVAYLSTTLFGSLTMTMTTMVTVTIMMTMTLSSVQSHSWVTCPPSFVNFDVGRGGVQQDTCENDGDRAYVTEVQAGDRIKVGWTSNNHGGGYARLSLVKFGEQTSEKILKKNVLKFTCYGHDTRPGKTRFGDCKHPCDARPGCQYQSNKFDIHRFDTTISIPTNLADGYYVLQAAMLVGNTQTPYNSCSKLKITGGNPNFSCKSNKQLSKYADSKCLKAGGPQLIGSGIESGSKGGDFCYRLNGGIGDIDEYIADVPINVECDPRLSCANSVTGGICIKENKMSEILTANSHPILPGCHVYTQIPDPSPTCNDGIRNGDEEGVDCGGSTCKECPAPIVPIFEGTYYSGIELKKGVPWASGAVLNVHIHVSRNITKEQCWRLSLQFQVPLVIKEATWGNGVLINQHKDLKIMTFSSNPDAQHGIAKERILRVSMQVQNQEYNNAISLGKPQDEIALHDWSIFPEKLNFLTAIFDVYDDINECTAV